MARHHLHGRRRHGATVGLGLVILSWGHSIVPGQLSGQQTPPTALAFRGVTVIDVTDGRHLPDQTVVVVGNRVQAVGQADKVSLPNGARVVEARGKYLIPGLWDMHAHVDGRAEEDYPRYIANGVTGIREMAQRFPHGADSFRVWQGEVAAGTRVGPRSVGPSTDLTSYVRPIKTEDDLRYVIDSIKAAGNVFIKFHGDFFPDGGGGEAINSQRRRIFFAALREARRVGLPVVGHSPDAAVTNVEAADSGQRSIEHTTAQYTQCWPGGDFNAPLPDSATFDRQCTPVVQAYLRNGTWLTPTLMIEKGAQWDTVLEFWHRMRRLGVKRFLAGTDVGAEVSAGEEMVALVDAGLSPLEALQAGTLNPALFFGATDSLGTVAAGKLADLVLLDDDPLVDIAGVLRVWGVVANGRYFDRAALDRLGS